MPIIPFPEDPRGLRLAAFLGRLQGRQRNLDTGLGAALSFGRQAQGEIQANRARDAAEVAREQTRRDRQDGKEADILRAMKARAEDRADEQGRFDAVQGRLTSQFEREQEEAARRHQESQERIKDHFTRTQEETARHHRAVEGKEREVNPLLQERVGILNALKKREEETRRYADDPDSPATDEQAPDILRQIGEDKERILGIRAPKEEPGADTDPRKLAAMESALIKLKQIEELRKAQGLKPSETPSVTPAQAKADERRGESQESGARRDYEAKLNALYEEAKDAVLKPRMGRMPTDPEAAAKVQSQIDTQFKARLQAAGITNVEDAFQDFKKRLPEASKRAGGKGGPGGEGGPDTGSTFRQGDASHRSLADLKQEDDKQLSAQRRKEDILRDRDEWAKRTIEKYREEQGSLAGLAEAWTTRGIPPPGTPQDVVQAFSHLRSREFAKKGILGKTAMGLEEALKTVALPFISAIELAKAAEQEGMVPRIPLIAPGTIAAGEGMVPKGSMGGSDVLALPALPFTITHLTAERLKESYPDFFQKDSTAEGVLDLSALLVPLAVPFVANAVSGKGGKPMSQAETLSAAREWAAELLRKAPEEKLVELRDRAVLELRRGQPESPSYKAAEEALRVIEAEMKGRTTPPTPAPAAPPTPDAPVQLGHAGRLTKTDHAPIVNKTGAPPLDRVVTSQESMENFLREVRNDPEVNDALFEAIRKNTEDRHDAIVQYMDVINQIPGATGQRLNDLIDQASDLIFEMKAEGHVGDDAFREQSQWLRGKVAPEPKPGGLFSKTDEVPAPPTLIDLLKQPEEFKPASKMDATGLSPEGNQERQLSILGNIHEELGNHPLTISQLAPNDPLRAALVRLDNIWKMAPTTKAFPLDDPNFFITIRQINQYIREGLEKGQIAPELYPMAKALLQYEQDYLRLQEESRRPTDTAGEIDLKNTPETPKEFGRPRRNELGAILNPGVPIVEGAKAIGRAGRAVFNVVAGEMNRPPFRRRSDELLRRYETLDPTFVKNELAEEAKQLEEEARRIAKQINDSDLANLMNQRPHASGEDLSATAMAGHLLDKPDVMKEFLKPATIQSVMKTVSEGIKKGMTTGEVQGAVADRIVRDAGFRTYVGRLVRARLKEGRHIAPDSKMGEAIREKREGRLESIWTRFSLADVNRVTPELVSQLNEPYVRLKRTIEADLEGVRQVVKGVVLGSKTDQLIARDLSERSEPSIPQAVTLHDARQKIMTNAFGNRLAEDPALVDELDAQWDRLLDDEQSGLRAFELFVRSVRARTILPPAIKAAREAVLPRYQGNRRLYAESVLRMLERGVEWGEIEGPIAGFISKQFARAAFVANPAPWFFNVMFSTLSNVRQLTLRGVVGGAWQFMTGPQKWNELKRQMEDLGLSDIRPEPLGQPSLWRRLLNRYDSLGFGPMNVGDVLTKGVAYLGARAEAMRIGQELVAAGRLRPEQLDGFVAANAAEHVRRVQQVPGPLSQSPTFTNLGPVAQFARSAYQELHSLLWDAIVKGVLKGNLAPILKHVVLAGIVGTIAEKMGFSIWKKFILSTTASSPLVQLADEILETPEDIQDNIILGLETDGDVLSAFRGTGKRVIQGGMGLSGLPIVAGRRLASSLIPADSESRLNPEGLARQAEGWGILPKKRPEPIETGAAEQLRRMVVGNYTQIRQTELAIYELARRMRTNAGSDPDQVEKDANKLDILLDRLDRLEGKVGGEAVVVPNVLQRFRGLFSSPASGTGGPPSRP